MSVVGGGPVDYRGTFSTDFAERAAYSEGAGPFRIVPAAVAVPATTADLVALVAYAAAEGVPLVPRGAGSGMPGGNVGPGIVVDLQRFGEPPRVSPEGFADVGAGTTWSALDGAAHAHGLCLPPNPSSGPFCTLAGMVATNAAGPRSVRAGSIRRWVRALRIVTADGDVVCIARDGTSDVGRSSPILQFERDVRPALLAARDVIGQSFPDTLKNSAGYALDAYLASNDLIDLFVGSEGTLGIITGIRVALAPRPPAVAGLLVGVADLADLGEIVEELRAHDPSAVELLDRSFLTIAGADVDPRLESVEAVLLLDFERGDAPEARAAVTRAIDTVRSAAVFARPALSSEERDALWRLRHAASPALAALPDTKRSLQIIEDGCVPVAALGQYVNRVRRAAAEHEIDIVAFGHAGDGHLHVNALVDTTRGSLDERLTALLGAVTATIRELRGTPSGEHGDGRLRAALLQGIFGSRVTDLFREVKQAFDPHGILNPGVVVPAAGEPAVGSLKVGTRAAPIPDRVARGLRDIERSGDWAKPKLDLARGGRHA